jgi:uncharacterized membrane protein
MATPGDLRTARAEKRPATARTHVLVSVACGVVAGVPVALATAWALWPLVAWDVAAGVYVTWVWLSIRRLDAHETARHAAPEDPTRAAADFLILSAAVASLVAVGFVLGRAARSQGAEQTLLALLGVASVVLSWTVVHMVYTLRYARLYYMDTDGGIDFNEQDPPTYADFAYVSFTIGMTFQVSDTDLESKPIRAAALRQSLLSFLFVTGILASAVNLMANL